MVEYLKTCQNVRIEKENFAHPPRVPTSKILFAPMDKASTFKNLPCAALTAISSKPSSRLRSSVFSNPSSFEMRNELWYSSDRVQSSCDVRARRRCSIAVDKYLECS